MVKTNAARILERNDIKYELFAYEVDEDDLSAVNVASKLQQSIEQVFKTLVLRGDKTGVIIAVIPGHTELELKKFAKISGNKYVEMVAMKEILEITGYIRGGCSPVGMKRKYPVFIHESCLTFGFIFISGGVRGLQIKLSPNDLVRLTEAWVGNLV